ncbi:uncharacterized protein B0H64DRAFT_322663 [Chaetomium fimeti]|uniref:Transcription factor domain-containing protein n=1 Tax=Chaetomium fimeti TaxID=1854472 RepID=A0AAE0HEX8_9PEZI|nr:hypothetical protein B0H64DRAFT_322663 [Chaetomium fimeti]
MSCSLQNYLSQMDRDEAEESQEAVGSGRSGSDPVHTHKTRRPHRKSRYGCTKCKARRIKPPDFSWLEQALPPAEFELLRHYLEHTSRHPTVGEHDKYTLQIGIPNLACQCKPLMRSVLALAATCKCCDIINQTSTPPAASDRAQVIELLSLAQQYHSESLHGIQATLYEAKNYDHVLANAAMMGMYGSASHAARIWLAKTAPFGEDPQLFDLTMPGNPQWMSLFRAVRLAYAGLLKSSPQLSPASTPPALTVQYDYKAASRVPSSTPSTPSHGHGHLAFPITDIQQVDDEAAERLAEISPWLRKYTASISSTVPSHVPRRTIMSFVHKVPTAYLNLIEDMIGRLQADEADEAACEAPSIAHQLAVEIFAHWLVLVMLLDNVWWIGEIGAWELGRFVEVRRRGGWEMCMWNRDRDWWPESMLEIGRQFDKHK